MNKKIFVFLAIFLFSIVIFSYDSSAGYGEAGLGSFCSGSQKDMTPQDTGFDAAKSGICGPCLKCDDEGVGGEQPTHKCVYQDDGEVDRACSFPKPACEAGKCLNCDVDNDGHIRPDKTDICEEHQNENFQCVVSGEVRSTVDGIDCSGTGDGSGASGDSTGRVNKCGGSGIGANACENKDGSQSSWHCCDGLDNECDGGTDCRDTDAQAGGGCSSYCSCIDKSNSLHPIGAEVDCETVNEDFEGYSGTATCVLSDRPSDVGPPHWDTSDCEEKACKFTNPNNPGAGEQSAAIGKNCYISAFQCNNEDGSSACEGKIKYAVCTEGTGDEDPSCETPPEAEFIIDPLGCAQKPSENPICDTASCDDPDHQCEGAKWKCNADAYCSSIDRPNNPDEIDPGSCDGDAGVCSECSSGSLEPDISQDQDASPTSTGTQDCPNHAERKESVCESDELNAIGSKKSTQKVTRGEVCEGINSCVDLEPTYEPATCVAGSCGAECSGASDCVGKSGQLGAQGNTCWSLPADACSGNCECSPSVADNKRPEQCDGNDEVLSVCDSSAGGGWQEVTRISCSPLCKLCADGQVLDQSTCECESSDPDEGFCAQNPPTCKEGEALVILSPTHCECVPSGGGGSNTPTCSENINDFNSATGTSREGGCSVRPNCSSSEGEERLEPSTCSLDQGNTVCCLCPEGSEFDPTIQDCVSTRRYCDAVPVNAGTPKHPDHKGVCDDPFSDVSTCFKNSLGQASSVNDLCCCSLGQESGGYELYGWQPISYLYPE